MKRLKNGKAPGTDRIPTEIVKICHKKDTGHIREAIDTCMQQGEFPKRWKEAKLILIPKPKKTSHEPIKYRPISLVNSMAKVMEQVINNRVIKHLDRTGGLSETQFGFRRGRSTIHAIDETIKTIRSGLETHGWTLAVCLDIRNAFNSIPWTRIMEAAREKDLPRDLQRILHAYLTDRSLVVAAGQETHSLQITRGVPQGSILGPTLWNLSYDKVLTLDLARYNSALIAYADDTVILTKGRTPKSAAANAGKATEQVVREIERMGLEVAEEKTCAVIFGRSAKIKRPEVSIEVKRRKIPTEHGMKYLGVHLDWRLSWGTHIKEAGVKCSHVTQQLARIMPNIGGPTEPRRRLLSRVGESIVLYGAEIWGENISTRLKTRDLLKSYRANAQRVACAYRTVSNEAAGVVAGIPPYDILAKSRAMGWKRRRELLVASHQSSGDNPGVAGGWPHTNMDNQNVMKIVKREREKWVKEAWQTRWDRNEDTAQWTKKLIPNIYSWVQRKQGQGGYYLTQMLTGHGAFNDYLKRMGKRKSKKCTYCGDARDDVEHTLLICPHWENERREAANGMQLEAGNMIQLMTSSPEMWTLISGMTRKILKTKETDDRDRGY